MGIDSIPTEVLDLIFDCLEKEKPDKMNRYRHLGAAVRPESLRNARLVCRQWNALATKHLFRTIALMHNGNDKAFDTWKQIVNSPAVQQAAREAEIYSVRPPPRSYYRQLERDYETWCSWDSGDWPEFVTAIQGLGSLPNLRAVNIRFTEGCEGVEKSGYREEIVETFSTRMHTIENVFKAIQRRKSRANQVITPITSLTIENLQNMPFTEFLETGLFRSVIEDITELRLLVAQEDHDDGPDYDLYYDERFTFEPWLQEEFLPCFASRLTSLNITFGECWGVAPGYFDGKGLHFPNLKTLILGEYVIGHHDQFDWVPAQTTLETLCLNRCMIVSYLEYASDDIEKWNDLTTHDWKFVADRGRGWTLRQFDGAWEVVFDAIRIRLPNLVQFRMEHAKLNDVAGRGLRSVDDMDCCLSAKRYVRFSSGTISPWQESDSDGHMDIELGGEDEAECSVVNRAMETQEGDMRAFKELLQAVEERARRRLQ
ncbi:hypothetical protein QC762_401980 [Podospora pseudocomata]|uniref:F-box domain-containing protein n=1 Tax=Podospora pseudocomata TaxID=2093779 RepID=A0ABR0GF56_9PEZI|nr:hypothetical protein QC762_401980 [Podospora pseudocomata]